MDLTKLTITELNALKKDIDAQIDTLHNLPVTTTKKPKEYESTFRHVYERHAPINSRPFKSECVCRDDYTDGTYAKLTRKVIGPTWRRGDYDTFTQITGHIGDVTVFEEI